jgi:hypothetical protein
MDSLAEARMKHLIPEHMWDGIRRYVDLGIPPGGFLTALLENDFMEAIIHADDISIFLMKDWARFIYNYLPDECWGSKEKVKLWVRNHKTEK